jgi:hypothetical protein
MKLEIACSVKRLETVCAGMREFLKIMFSKA